MEELGSTRHWEKKPHGSTVFARSAYDDFFGGPPKQTTTFPARFEDYCEIFGNAAAASSIPVLDLPLDDEEFVSAGDGDRQVVVDYSDIFGGLSGSGFAVSYEELFGGSKRSGVSSLDVSARWGVFPEQQANEASEDLMEGYSEDNLANLDKAEVSVPHHSDDASSKLFSMSYNKTSWGIIDDLIGEKTNTAKLDAIPEFTLPVDASDPVLEMKNQQVNEPMANNTGTKRHTHDVGQENEAPSNSSPNAAYSENLRVDQAPSKYICDSLLDASEIEKHHSRSSSYHSASSGDTALSDVDYLNISEISLQTKPLQGPPPSRPPPQLIKKQEHPKMAHVDSSLLRPMPKHHIISSSGATKIHAVDENMEGNSCCYDYEMDPNSAAAASVAAVKAAMEQAQARLKVAKELMDRKRDKYKRKVDQPKVMACEDDRADYEVALKSCSKEMAAKNMLKENNYSINEYTILEREEIKNAKFNEVSDEWKTEKKYYDLIRNGSLLKKVEDNYTHENEKNAKTDVNGCQDIYKDGKKGEQFFEVLKDQKLPEASRSIEKLENDHNLNGASMAYMNDSNNNVVNAIVEDFVLMESASKLNEAYDYHILDDTKKEGDVHEDNTIEDGDNSLKSAVDSCLRKSSEKDFQISNEEIEINGAEKIFRNVGNKMEFHVDHVNFELNESHKLFNFATEAIFQGRRSDEEGRESDGVCSNNTTGKMEVTKETRKFNENGRETESMKYPYASNVSDACKVEENNNAKEVDDADGLQINEEACILTKNELEKEIIQDINGLENGNERRDAPIELQENKSVGPDMNQELHNSEFSAEVESDYAENQSENSSEVPVACNFWENETVSTSAKEVCQQGEESDAPEIILSGKEDNSPDETPDTTEASYAEVAENHKHTVYTEEEENRKADREKERDKERALRLEEKEREKEREKDRIAVEIANQRAFAEARERAERIAVERVAAEARQRALAEAREKAEKAAEAEKALREARLRAERAAVERATEEARQRAIEKALVEKAAIEARSRKGNATAYFKAAHVKEDSDTRVKSSSEILQNTQSQCPACSTNGQRYSDSCDNGGSESKLRCKARQERQQRTAERAAKALAEKNLRDILAQREQAERDRLAESLDAEVRRWSNGKEGNLRALLSTLQYILGSDSGWQPIPLTDVLTAAAVKKAYRKATLSVHPDKLQQRGATIQQKYICEKVFDLLKEAWNKFNSGNDGR